MTTGPWSWDRRTDQNPTLPRDEPHGPVDEPPPCCRYSGRCHDFLLLFLPLFLSALVLPGHVLVNIYTDSSVWLVGRDDDAGGRHGRGGRCDGDGAAVRGGRGCRGGAPWAGPRAARCVSGHGHPMGDAAMPASAAPPTARAVAPSWPALGHDVYLERALVPLLVDECRDGN